MEYEQLSTLLGAYYHEDFDGIWATFDLYARDASLEEMIQLGRDITEFLRQTPAESVPAETWRLGSMLWLAESHEPYVDWLKEIVARIDGLVRAERSA